MADNVTVDNGTLTDYTTATDDVGGVQFQKVKLDVGGDGVSTPVEGSMPVSGDVASGDADAGNPVKIGGRAFVVDPTPVNDGERVDVWLSSRGAFHVFPEGGASIESSSTDGIGELDVLDALAYDGTVQGPLRTGPSVFNESTWDRLRGDTLGLHISRQATAATATLSNVAGSASSVTLKAANAARKGLSIHNDSSAILYVKFGTTASTSSYTVKMVADAYFEVPFGYTGRIDGIWASATGNARVTEMT